MTQSSQGIEDASPGQLKLVAIHNVADGSKPQEMKGDPQPTSFFKSCQWYDTINTMRISLSNQGSRSADGTCVIATSTNGDISTFVM